MEFSPNLAKPQEIISQPSRIESYLENSAAVSPAETALVCGTTRLTYADVNRLANKLAAGLVTNGFIPGDRALIFLENSPATVVALFAVLKAGGTFSILNPQTRPQKLEYLLKDSGARVLFIEPRLRRVFDRALTDATDLETVIWAGAGDRPPAASNEPNELRHLDYAHLTETEAETVPPVSSFGNRDLQALATIIYTSGSTGEPKGVMCPHHSVACALNSIIEYLELTSRDKVVVFLPLAFDYGLYQILMTFKVGGAVILQRGFDYPEKCMQVLRKEKVTVLPIVPTIATMLLAKSNLKPRLDVSVRAITNTAAPLTAKHVKGLTTVFPQASLYAMYGLTECKRVSYLPPDYIDAKADSVGIPMRGVHVCIADSEGQPVPPGEIGELLIQGPNVMQGYWKAPEETARVFRRDPLTGAITLHSGDLFKQDADGFLYFVARKDDMVKIRGERVYPLEIEKILHGMPGVGEVSVIALQDENDDNCLAAVVTTDRGHPLSENDIRMYCRRRLEPHLMPHRIIFVPQIKKSPNGKIDKSWLQDLFERMECIPDYNREEMIAD